MAKWNDEFRLEKKNTYNNHYHEKNNNIMIAFRVTYTFHFNNYEA